MSGVAVATTTDPPEEPTMRLVTRDGFLAAEIEGPDGPPLTVEAVRELRERPRR